MADPSLFIVIALFTIASALLVFLFRKIVHSVLALTAAFIMSAVIFLYLGQTLIALLQALIFVGGLSTYLIVAIGVEEKGQKYSDPRVFLLTTIILAAGFSIMALQSGNPTPAAQNIMQDSAAASLQSYYALIFAAVLLLFSAAMGSVIFIKKFVKPVM
jgi:NADH:ubiquinone oxidoreductase subunit 6 (subunit J)